MSETEYADLILLVNAIRSDAEGKKSKQMTVDSFIHSHQANALDVLTFLHLSG